MIVQCPKCFTKLRAGEEHRGKRLKCLQCGQVFQASPASHANPPRVESSVTSGKDNIAPQVTSPPRQSGLQESVKSQELPGLSTGLPKAGRQFPSIPAIDPPEFRSPASSPVIDDDDDSIWADDSNAMMDFQEPAVAGSGRRARPSSDQSGVVPTHFSIGFGTIADFALDRGMISWALIWGLIWSVSVAMSGLLARLLPSVIPILPFVLMLLTWGCYIASISGISRLAVLKALSGTTHGLTEAWNLLSRRGLSLLLGTLAIGSGVGLGVVFVLGGIYGISHIPHAGGILGGILMVPTFIIILLTISLVINLYLLPIIISVEDCTAIRAGEILIRVTAQDGFALLGRYLRALASLIPFALFSGFLTAGGLMGAFLLCGGEQILYSLRSGIPVGSMLQALSAVFVVSAWMAFLVVFTTVSFTLVYCDSSQRTNTHDA